MKCINNYIGVTFDAHEKTHTKLGDSGIEILNIHRWQSENNEDGNLWDGTRDKRITNPEIATVVFENDKLPYKKGDKLFVHFLAYESSVALNGAVLIDAKMVFFRFNDNNIEMTYENYLGEQVMMEEVKTESGIFLTPYEDVKKECYIKILHVPENDKYVSPDDVIVTVDNKQYTLNFNGKQYVKMRKDEVMVKVKDNKLIPL